VQPEVFWILHPVTKEVYRFCNPRGLKLYLDEFHGKKI